MRPSFLKTASERAMSNAELASIGDLSERYRSLVASIFTWEGMPEGMPSDLVERALFDVGGFGIKDTGGTIGKFGVAGRAYERDHYGRGTKWNPILPDGYTDNTGLLSEPSESPLLEVVPMFRVIQPYLEVYAHAIKAIRANVFAMQQPVLLEGAMENKIEGEMITWELLAGKLTIPTLKAVGVPYKVLDLKVTDWTVSLGAVMDAMDREILTVMGVRNSGTEKASGITTEETTSITQQLVLWAESQLQIRKDWVALENAKHGSSISVRIADAYMISDSVPDNKQDGEGNGAATSTRYDK